MKNIIIFISLQTYLRNWIDAGAFIELQKNHNVLFVIPEYDWDPKEIENYGISNYKVIKQVQWRKILFRKILMITMVRYSKRSFAFKIKTSVFSSKSRKLVSTLLSKDIFYHLFLFLCKILLGKWKQVDKIFKEFKPDIVIAPSLAADSFTIDLTYTANRNNIKSLMLINSWDNLVSKGVIPIQPSYIGLWGQQSFNEAIRVQQLPKEKLVILGVPRFENYYKKNNNSISIHALNNIPLQKKIILYAATVMPFDDIQALRLLNNEIKNNPEFKDYVILFRAHPEMMERVEETNLQDYAFENVFIDIQTAKFYLSRFNKTDQYKSSTINETSLDYYPSLFQNIVAMVCPPTTLSVEGLINGKPCLMICYNDGKNHYLSPEKMSQYENVREVLALDGVIPCFEETSFLENFRKLIHSSINTTSIEKIKNGTRNVVYNDAIPYAQRLNNFVQKII